MGYRRTLILHATACARSLMSTMHDSNTHASLCLPRVGATLERSDMMYAASVVGLQEDAVSRLHGWVQHDEKYYHMSNADITRKDIHQQGRWPCAAGICATRQQVASLQPGFCAVVQSCRRHGVMQSCKGS